MRTIKFRYWDGDVMFIPLKIMNPVTVPDCEDGILMQFTGLLDKNGKEIYEGDIVKSEGVDKVFIENVPDLLKLGHLLGEHIFVPDTVEIIGNIYENPELLTPTN